MSLCKFFLAIIQELVADQYHYLYEQRTIQVKTLGDWRNFSPNKDVSHLHTSNCTDTPTENVPFIVAVDSGPATFNWTLS